MVTAASHLALSKQVAIVWVQFNPTPKCDKLMQDLGACQQGRHCAFWAPWIEKKNEFWAPKFQNQVGFKGDPQTQAPLDIFQMYDAPVCKSKPFPLKYFKDLKADK